MALVLFRLGRQLLATSQTKQNPIVQLSERRKVQYRGNMDAQQAFLENGSAPYYPNPCYEQQRFYHVGMDDRRFPLYRASTSGYSRTRRRTSVTWLVCAVVVNIIVVVGVVLGTLYILKLTQSSLLVQSPASEVDSRQTESSSQDSNCLPCPAVDATDTENRKTCCPANSVNLQKFIENSVKLLLKSEPNRTPPKDNRSTFPLSDTGYCGALFFLHGHEATNGNELQVLKNWSTQGGIFYAHPCIDYDKASGEVTIKETGFYLVYTHLSFVWNETLAASGRSTVLAQQIVQIGSDVPLALDRRAIQPGDPKVGRIPTYNSHAMSVVLLRGGARVRVEAKPRQLVVDENKLSSFGLFKLKSTS